MLNSFKKVFIFFNTNSNVRLSSIIITFYHNNKYIISNSSYSLLSSYMSFRRGNNIEIVSPKIWYKNIKLSDCEEILEKSILNDKVISRLEIKDLDLDN